MRIGFATDIHLDHVKDVKGLTKHRRVGRQLTQDLDVLILGGDLSTATQLRDHLAALHRGAEDTLIYFVLGNHDFWAPTSNEGHVLFVKGTSEPEVRVTAGLFPGYLDKIGLVELTSEIGLVGRSGWYDVMTGNPFESKIRTNDFLKVKRLQAKAYLQNELWRECQRWSESETLKARPVLKEAAEKYQKVFFVTHFPCFKEACWDEYDRPDVEENGWWPWSIDTTMGHMLSQMAATYPGVEFTVLTGHTHGRGEAQLSSNLTCISGKAVYGQPKVSRTWNV